MLKIVVDDKIPFIIPALQKLADCVVVLPGKDICSSDVKDATILVVRTRTRCNRDLLHGSSVRLIVTATIGYDHIDTAYLAEQGIQWTNCPGCNANSVAQYIHSSLLLLKRERGLVPSNSTLGIIGVGHVGTAVLKAVSSLGFKQILLNDPPRSESGDNAPAGFQWSSLDQLLAECDVLTLHVPHTKQLPHPTHHLIDAEAIHKMKRRPVIINAARGGVIDEQALERALDEGLIRNAIIDTWENEPVINTSLLNKVYLGTPHIAGYSADGKANATRMSLEAICRFLGKPMTFDIQPPALDRDFVPSDNAEQLALQLYDPRTDSTQLKATPKKFEWFRGHYPLRREFCKGQESK